MCWSGQGTEADNSRVYLGARDFDRPEVPAPPAASANRTTSLVFRLLCGLRIRDTQTGLRAIPRALLAGFCAVPGSALSTRPICCWNSGRKSCRIPDCRSKRSTSRTTRPSHFRPGAGQCAHLLAVSAALFAVCGCSLLCFGLDLLLFAPAQPVCVWAPCRRPGADFCRYGGGRVGSSLCNFWLNRRLVFPSGRAFGATLWRYYLLCICQLLTSALLVYLLQLALPLPKTLLKGLGVPACFWPATVCSSASYSEKGFSAQRFPLCGKFLCRKPPVLPMAFSCKKQSHGRSSMTGRGSVLWINYLPALYPAFLQASTSSRRLPCARPMQVSAAP